MEEDTKGDTFDAYNDICYLLLRETRFCSMRSWRLYKPFASLARPYLILWSKALTARPCSTHADWCQLHRWHGEDSEERSSNHNTGVESQLRRVQNLMHVSKCHCKLCIISS